MADLKERDVFDDVPKKVQVTVDSNMTGPEVRDRIREQLNLHQIDGQLEQLTFHAEEEEEESVPALETEWEPIRQVLFRYKDEEPSIRFTCILRSRQDSESIWENDAPPSAVSNLVQKEKNDVVPKAPITAEKREEAYRNVFAMTAPNLETPFEPMELFGGDKERITRFYDGYDVTTSKGRRDWQMRVLDRIAGFQIPYEQDPKVAAFKKFSRGHAEALNQAFDTGVATTIDLEDEKVAHAGRARYYAYQTATTGTHAHVGPPIDLAVKAHSMVRKDRQNEEYYACTDAKATTKRTFRPYQVNGLAWALSRLYDAIPLPDLASENVKKAASAPQQPFVVPGLLIADQTGLGKTPLGLLIASYCKKPFSYNKGKGVFKPVLLQVPQGLIGQWADEILQYWPGLTLIISHDDTAMPAT